MGQKYVYNPLTCEYDIIDEGAPGLPGPRGPIGASGVGVPSGGTTGQVLSKTSDDDHDTEWTNPGGGGTLQNVMEVGNTTDVELKTVSNILLADTLVEGEETKYINLSTEPSITVAYYGAETAEGHYMAIIDPHSVSVRAGGGFHKSEAILMAGYHPSDFDPDNPVDFGYGASLTLGTNGLHNNGAHQVARLEMADELEDGEPDPEISMYGQHMFYLPFLTPSVSGHNTLATREWVRANPSEVVDDTSPQLGGDLESNGHGLLIGDLSIRSGLDMDGVGPGVLMLGETGGGFAIPGIGSVGDLYIASNIGEDGSGDWLPQMYMNGLDVEFELAPGGSLVIESPVSGGASHLDPSGLTGTRTLYLPDKDGTILVDRNPRVLSTASIATIEPDVDEYDQYIVTAQAAALGIDDPLGTAVVGGKILFALRDNGTPRALTWDSSYRGIGVTLPTTTVAGKWMYVGAVYNAADSKWDVIAVMEEA